MKMPLLLIAALVAGAFLAAPVQLTAAEPAPATKVKSGTTFVNADIARVAKAWERQLGGTVTVSDRARARKVSLEISAASKDEYRKRFIAALRENGIHVIERADGVVFDTEPAPKSK